jgi:hypothetical protein
MTPNLTSLPGLTSAAAEWTSERIAKLERDEIEQLRANALNLGEEGVAALCAAALANCRKPRQAAAVRKPNARPLVSRSAAFESRGVYLQNARSSWGGVRKSDGTVVLGLWADAVKSRDGGCSCLLWSANVDGSHPWSDSEAGRERLQHCELVVAGAPAEGLLVFGESLEGHQPEEKTRTVYGVDAQSVVRFSVEKRGDGYWAVWGKRATPRR